MNGYEALVEDTDKRNLKYPEIPIPIPQSLPAATPKQVMAAS
jgi:hypothetical protein